MSTIGVPHPFMIGSKHIEHASKLHSGMLGEATMKAVPCVMRGCTLKYDQHEIALLVECKAPLQDAEGKATPELHQYLLTCKPLAEEDGYVGFAFHKAEGTDAN